MNKLLAITVTLTFTFSSIFSQEMKPKWVVKTNTFNLFVKTAGCEVEYFLPAYFSISSAWYNTGMINTENFLWAGNVYTGQLNYFFRNKTQKGWYFSLYTQLGKWNTYDKGDKHVIAKITALGGGILFAKKWIISKSKRWLLEPGIGYQQTIALNKLEISKQPEELPPTKSTRFKLILNLAYVIH